MSTTAPIGGPATAAHPAARSQRRHHGHAAPAPQGEQADHGTRLP